LLYGRAVSRFVGGSFECRLISDGELAMPAEAMFAGAPEAERAGDPIAIPYGCLLVRGEGVVALVDAGLGAYEHPLGGTGGELIGALADAGVAAGDVGLLLITHAHIDHIGGLCAGGRPQFESARHVMSRVERESRHDRVAAEQLEPLERAGLLELVEAPFEPVPGLRLIPAPGHTPGHLALEIGGPDGALFLADAIVDPRHVEHPEWTLAFDDDPEVNVATRRALLGDAADSGRVIAASHIRTAGTVERTPGGLRFLPA
jgi:glyoxylase-like metal-dependent hydrolase (beta-lactamase superfamily II)